MTLDSFRAKLGEDANFITILREPAKNFESSYSYFGKEKALNLTAKEYLRE